MRNQAEEITNLERDHEGVQTFRKVLHYPIFSLGAA